MSFSKTSNSTRPSDSCYFEVFEKLTRACYIQIALETMLLPILKLEKIDVFKVVVLLEDLFVVPWQLPRTQASLCKNNSDVRMTSLHEVL